ncbi:MAG: GldG family protein [Holophagales bacterium]|nr:MAG: GldG family protein [Holophagales bacterium]
MARPETRQQLLAGGTLSVGVILVAALLAIVNYFGFKYYHRFDWTHGKLYTLSEKSLGVLDGLKKDVDVVVFMRPGGELFEPVRELLERYAAKSPHVKVRVVDPEKNLVEAQQLVDKYKVSSLSVVVFDSGDDRRVIEEADLADFDYSGMQFGAGPQMTGFKGEEAFSGALLELAEQRKPKILFTSGHGELSLDDVSESGLSQAQALLGKENFEMKAWASLGQAEVPAGTDLVVVAGPRARFAEPELAALGRYLAGGGRMLVLIDPTLAPGGGGLVDTGLGAWLANYGVKLGDDIVVDPSNPLPFYGAETIFVNAEGTHPVVRALEQAKLPVILPLARSVSRGTPPAGAEVNELLRTSAEGWGEIDLANLRAVAKGPADLAGPVSVAIAAGPAAAKPPAVAEDDEDPQANAKAAPAVAPVPWRLVVVGDADFATNAQLANVGNPTLLANTLNWMVERQKLLGIGPKAPEQVRLNLSASQLRWVTLWVLLGLPGLAVAAGLWMHLRRRR